MSSAQFNEQFSDEFGPNVESFLKSKDLPRKAVLLIDNTPTHPQNLTCGDIVVKFVPANVTSLIQTLDQRVIECFKRHYRGLFLRLLLQETNESKSVPDLKNNKHETCCLLMCSSMGEGYISNIKKLVGDIENEKNLQTMVEQLPGCEDINQKEIREQVVGDEPELDFNNQDIVEMVMSPPISQNMMEDVMKMKSRQTAAMILPTRFSMPQK